MQKIWTNCKDFVGTSDTRSCEFVSGLFFTLFATTSIIGLDTGVVELVCPEVYEKIVLLLVGLAQIFSAVNGNVVYRHICNLLSSVISVATTFYLLTVANDTDQWGWIVNSIGIIWSTIRTFQILSLKRNA